MQALPVYFPRKSQKQPEMKRSLDLRIADLSTSRKGLSAVRKVWLLFSPSTSTTPLRPPPTHEPAMEMRKILCNALNILKCSCLGKSIKTPLVLFQMACALMVTRLLMRWTRASLTHIKHSESMHQSLSGSSTVKSPHVSSLFSL